MLKQLEKLLRTKGKVFFQKIIKVRDFSFHEEIHIVRRIKILKLIYLIRCKLKLGTLFNYSTGDPTR